MTDEPQRHRCEKGCVWRNAPRCPLHIDPLSSPFTEITDDTNNKGETKK